jgi:hypothetical protein
MERLSINGKHIGTYKAPEEYSRNDKAVPLTESHNDWSWDEERSKDRSAKIGRSGEATNC